MWHGLRKEIRAYSFCFEAAFESTQWITKGLWPKNKTDRIRGGGWGRLGEDRAGGREGGWHVAHQWSGVSGYVCLCLSPVRAMNIYSTNHKAGSLEMRFIKKEKKKEDDTKAAAEHGVITSGSPPFSGFCFDRSSPDCCIKLTQLFISRACSCLDVAPPPRWPRARRRTGSTCRSTWALPWEWRLGCLCPAESQVRDCVNINGEVTGKKSLITASSVRSLTVSLEQS